ncbi:type I-E CRISPR-associated protein Cas5/CasD [Streptomyces violascens]|uniref:type I-E CRISPR-associated protein Cas5/CasD n=1 Tax=Streptomyces violascens TaxID=67381 RepID=UPI0036A137B4
MTAPPAPVPGREPGLVLRLAGPLSAYGTDAAFTHRDTAPHPTRAALIGLCAAAAGAPRERALEPLDLPGRPSYRELSFTIRVDNPGTLHTDFHTTGARRPRHLRLPTSNGSHRPAARSTHITHRTYLADAAFTVAARGPAPLITHLAHILEHPHWAPYLGRRCCIPDEPLVLTGPLSDPLAHLMHHTPLTLRAAPDPDQDRIPVTFWWDTPPPTARSADAEDDVADDPLDYTPHHRSRQIRRRWRTTEHLPAYLYAGSDPLPALTAYCRPESPCPPPP